MPLKDIEQTTLGVYERQGARFDQERPKVLFEKKWLARFQALLPDNAHILDVGCGAGEPIAGYFIRQGIQLTGVDFAAAMLEISRSRFPDNRWVQMDMRKLALDERYDGLIAWHSFFHLTQEDQRLVLKLFADHLKPGGVMLLTVGHEAGEVIGHVGDESVYHASLSPEKYEAILKEKEMKVVEFVPEDPDVHGSTILLAQKAIA